MKAAHVILADNQEIVRGAVRELLKGRKDCQVCLEVNTSEALLRSLERQRPALVILGSQFPQEIGSLILEIRRRLPSVEILVLSTVDSKSQVRRAAGAGARGYVFSTDSKLEIVRAMKRLIRGQPYFSSRAAQYVLDSLQTSNVVEPADVRGKRRLSSREEEVVQLLANAESNKRIADILKISVRTVETHRARIMNKLGLNSVLELVRYAIANGLVDS